MLVLSAACAALLATGCMIAAGRLWDALVDVRFWLGLLVLPLIPAFIVLAVVLWLAAATFALLAVSEGVGFL